METVVVAAIGATPLLIAQALAWKDMRRRTNGSGPLAAVLKDQTERLVRIEERCARTENRVGRIEERLSEPR